MRPYTDFSPGGLHPTAESLQIIRKLINGKFMENSTVKFQNGIASNGKLSVTKELADVRSNNNGCPLSKSFRIVRFQFVHYSANIKSVQGST